MNLRLSLYELAARHRLGSRELAGLCRLAALHEEPAAVAAWVPRVVAALAALLLGLGVIFWVAAHWDALGRLGQFALLQALVAVLAVGAAASAAARAPLSLLALLAIGALFAFFGQTYQTGADAWQLFATWAALALPLALAARSDVVWAPWALVAVSALSLWVRTHTAHQWRFQAQDVALHALAWGVAILLVAWLGPAARRLSGAGAWSYRTALVLAVIVVTGSALGALFADGVAPLYWLALVVAALAIGALASARGFDIFGLSVVVFAANVLLVAGLARWLFQALGHDSWLLVQLPLGVAAAALLAASVSGVMRVARRRRSGAAQ